MLSHMLLPLVLLAVGTRPNIVFILTDDQDAHTTGFNASGMQYMPATTRLLHDQGALFANAVLATPLCAPSRAVLLTGRYPHNTEVFLNSPLHGAFAYWEKNENSSVAVALQRAGYITFMTGKYMNGYGNRPTHVPLGWSDWHGFTDVVYFAPTVNENGNVVTYSNTTYSTDLIKDKALAFLKNYSDVYLRHARLPATAATAATAVDERDALAAAMESTSPFFMYLAPKAPHLPSQPAPRHAALFKNISGVPRVPSFNEPSNATQQMHASWIGQLPILSPAEVADEDSLFVNRIRCLQAVDELVEAVVGQLQLLGVLENTYVVYMGDNGFHQGHHRMPHGKQTAFEEDIRVPLLMRGPGVAKGVVVTPLVGNYDLAPTFLAIAQAAPLVPMDGKSFLPLADAGAVGAAASSSAAAASSWNRSFTLQEGFFGCYPGVTGGVSCEVPTAPSRLHDPFAAAHSTANSAAAGTPSSREANGPMTCTLENDVNYKAHGIGSPVTTDDAAACCTLCAANAACVLFTWNSRLARGKCVLKSAVGNSNTSPGTVSGRFVRAEHGVA